MLTLLAILALLAGSTLLSGRQAEKWQKAGIITAAQAAAIHAHEKATHGRKIIYGLCGLAVFAIGLGILAIVAANWAHVSGTVKIAAHVLLNIAAALIMLHAAKENKKFLRECATFLFFALNLTLIVLIGQVFQLHGTLAGALSFWMLLSTPAVFLYGQTRLNAAPWILAAIATVSCDVEQVIKHSSHETQFLVSFGLALFTPLILLGAGASQKLKALRPHWTQSLTVIGAGLLATLAIGSSLEWYFNMPQIMQPVFVTPGFHIATLSLCAAAIIAVYLYEYACRLTKPNLDRSGIIFTVGSLLSVTLPLIVLPDSLNVMSAVHFIAYATFLGYLGYRIGHRGLTSAAMGMVALRLIVIYFELFGGLLSTGLGLVGSGILLLIILKFSGTLLRHINDISYKGGKNDW